MPHRKEISDKTLEALKASVLDAVIGVDADGRILAWNPVAEEIFGWSEAEVMGQNLGDIVIPEVHRAGHAAGMKRFGETGIARVVGRRIEVPALHREGHEFPIELAIVQAPEGGEAAFIGFVRDISERKAAETRLTLSEESLRLATEAAEIGTWDLDLATGMLNWSDRTKAMFGFPSEARCSLDDFYAGLHPDDLDATTIAFASALDPQKRATYDVEYRTVGKTDGRIRWVAAKGKGLFEDDMCVRAVGTAIDITARKLEEARQAVMAELDELLRSRDTAASLHSACALMGRYFGASRVGYGLLDPVQDMFSYDVCWTDGHVPPLIGDYPAHVFGEKIVACLSAGETVVVDDLFADPLSNQAQTLETATEVDTRAILVVPFLRGDRLRTIVYLNAQKPRHWSADLVAFMEMVADRTRQLIERAEAEAEIAEREAEFQMFAQAMPNHVWAAGADGGFDWFNAQVYAYGGVEEGALDGDAWLDLLHPDDAGPAADLWAQALRSGDIYETQFRVRRADGVYRWHISRALPIRDTAGKIVRWIGTNTDIEDQRATLEALDRLTDTLKDQVADQLAENDRLWTLSQDPFLIADRDGNWLRVSPAITDILGWSEDDLIGRTSEWITHPDDIGRTRQRITLLKGGDRSFHFENRLRAKDGSYRFLSWNAVPEGDLMYCTARDVTEDHAQARALRDQQDFTQLALGSVGGVGVWSYDIAAGVYFYDEAIARLYGVDPEAGRTGLARDAFLVNICEDDMPEIRAALANALSHQGLIELEYRIHQADGSMRWVLSRGYTQIEDGRALRRTGIGVDVTEKRRLEDQLRQSQKMEAVGQLTGGIAHDFNNMLAVVMGSLELLARRLAGGDARAQHYVQAASDAAKRAANLTQRLLAFSRQQPLKPEVIDLNRLVLSMSDLLRHSIGADIRLETVLAAGGWRTEADPNQLENVILNLSVNARDAMPGGGRLTIETQNAHLDPRYVSSELGVPPGQYVLIAVTDTGTGMPPEVIARAFDPFFTTKEVGKGTGLGLSQVYGFVKQSGGHVRIYSEVGVGTTIKIYLPRAENAGGMPDADTGDHVLVGGDDREIILVVDDEDAVRQFSVDALSELGYRVLEAPNAHAALDILSAQKRISLLFTDVVMPDLNGRKLADAATAIQPDLKVLYTTGYTRNAVVHNGILDKGVHLIGKPFTLDELSARVRGILDEA